MKYRIRIDPEAPSVAIVTESGSVLQSYPMQAKAGRTWIPVEALLIIETLKEEGMELDCIEYPFQADS